MFRDTYLDEPHQSNIVKRNIELILSSLNPITITTRSGETTLFDTFPILFINKNGEIYLQQIDNQLLPIFVSSRRVNRHIREIVIDTVNQLPAEADVILNETVSEVNNTLKQEQEMLTLTMLN